VVLEVSYLLLPTPIRIKWGPHGPFSCTGEKKIFLYQKGQISEIPKYSHLRDYSVPGGRVAKMPYYVSMEEYDQAI